MCLSSICSTEGTNASSGGRNCVAVSGPFAYEVDNKKEDIKNNFIKEFVQYFIILSIVQNFQFK